MFCADQLLRDLDQEIGLGYEAIPNLFASLLSQKTCYINNRLITWHLAQHSDKRLGVVSNILEASYTTGNGEIKKGSFFYKVEFRLQTQIGSPHRWLHLYIRCQRLADEAIEHLNNGRDTTILVGVQQPRLSGWSASPTLVRLTLTGKAQSPRWKQNPAHSLAASVEYLCGRYDIPCPSWVHDAQYGAPWFDAPMAHKPLVRAFLLEETPEPFARRNIYCGNRVFANKYEFAEQYHRLTTTATLPPSSSPA